MAPANARKRKSDEMEEPVGAVTPTGSPARKKMKITQSQKQALMDNLQLEITERARQLRAGYALQCADLRARIERRVNRIPISIRKMSMGELMKQHEATKSTQTRPPASPSKQTSSFERGPLIERPLPPLPPAEPMKLPSPARPQAPAAVTRGKKRKSSDIQITSDKENDAPSAMDILPVVKNNKRSKVAATGTRTASRTAAKQASVLSPRSHNSRTHPRSPVKETGFAAAAPTSPAKSMIARPAMSPMKPTSPFKSAATAATSAISASVHGMLEHAKRGTAATAKLTRTASKEKATTTTTRGQMLPPPKPPVPSSPERAVSRSSSTRSASTDASTTSNGTTVTKPKRGGRNAATAASRAKAAEPKSPSTTKKGGVARAASAAKTALRRNATGANKKVTPAEQPSGGRVLRKRT